MNTKKSKKPRRKEPMRDKPFAGRLLSVKLSDELWERLEKLADAEMRNLASTARMILNKHLPK